MEGKIREKASANFRCRYNCCQAVACAACEQYGVSRRDMFRMTEGFGLGMGGLKDTCGAVTGMFLIISLANSGGDMEDPTKTKMDTYQKFQEAAEAFRKKKGSVYCRDLKTEEGPQPLACCMECVEEAGEILEEMLKKWNKMS